MLEMGDNADSEIEAGNRLGITTVQVLRPGVPRSSKAAHHIQGLVELGPILIDPAGPVCAVNVDRRCLQARLNSPGVRRPETPTWRNRDPRPS